MKRNLSLLILLTQVFIGFGQISFKQVPPPAPAPQIVANFDDVLSGSVAFSDIDGDSDQDVLITGMHENGSQIAKLYTNDGDGSYTEVIGTPFHGVMSSSIAFSDIDNDGDQDVLITGAGSSGSSTKLYTNDGTGNFSEVTGTPFTDVHYSSISFSDIDNDGDKDVLITGKSGVVDRIAKLYKNDGTGNFTEEAGTPFPGVINSSIVFSDVDNDGDQDVLITGENASNIPISKLYTNDGSGNFTEITGTPFVGVRFSSIDFADIDSDNDQDVLITGLSASGKVSKLYTNNGAGIFTEVTGTNFTPVGDGSVAFTDIDNDGDQDIMISGYGLSDRQAKLYINDGVGSFTEVTGTPFIGVTSSSVAIADIDNDNNQDILITGSTGDICTKLYINDGGTNFRLVRGSFFEGVRLGTSAFSDVDLDGNQDLFITGQDGSLNKLGKLYTNNGSVMFTENIGNPFDSIQEGSVKFCDIDGDADDDLLITGINMNFDKIAKLYANDGTGNFTELIGTPFDGVKFGSIDFADIDLDGDQDLLITGHNSSLTKIAKLYINDGFGDFTLVTGTPFDGVWNGSIAFSDVNGDGAPDVLITGHNSTPEMISKLYLNDGFGNFSEVMGTPFDGVWKSSIDFADVDQDGDQDVLISGENNSSTHIAKLYMNDGTGNFSEALGTPFEGVKLGSIAFSDLEGSGFPDLLITGENNTGSKVSKLYENDGLGNFSEVIGTPFSKVWYSSISFSDIDNDGDKDVLITGQKESGERISELYLKVPCLPNYATDFLTVCDSITWIDGITYTSSNNSATYSLTNVNGCDSIITLNLTVNNSNSGTDIISTCDSLTWIDGNTYYNNNNTATYTLTNLAGCDSIVTLDLTVSNSTSSIDTISTCDSLTWIDGNTYYSNNNTATYTLTNVAGCDSIVTLDLTILNFEEIDTVNTCTSYTWPVDGNTYSQSGIYSALFTNQAGCDSTYTLDLTIDCSLYANVSVTNNIGSNCDGEAQATVYNGTPPYTFLYSNGETSSLIQNLCSGVYELTVTDNNLDNYNTTFIISDETVDYNSDSTYQAYLDSLYSSATSNCNYDYSQPVDSFIVDQNSIIQLDQNIYQATWYIYQNTDTFIITKVYYTTEDINGSFAYTLNIFCDDVNRSVLQSVLFIYKTKGTAGIYFYEKEDVHLYPNPTSKIFHLDVPESLIGKSLILTNSIGKIIMRSEITSTNNNFDIRGLAKGIYLVQIQTHEGKITKKLKID